MKTTNSQSFNPSVPKPRTFSQTTKAPAMGKPFGAASISSGTTAAPGAKRMGPLSVPRSGCCGK